MHVVVSMPVFNEANGIAEFVAEVASSMSPYITTFVVADDCSTDNTLQVLTELALTHQVKILPGKRNLGHGPTTLRALHGSLALQPDVVVAVDGDGQFAGHDMRRLVDSLTIRGLDLVEGVRIGRDDPVYRKATSWATRILVQFRFGMRPIDANTPLRVYRPSALEALLEGVPSDAITPNLIISGLSRVSNLRIGEERVTSIPRRGGDPAGSTWRARRKSVPSVRFIKFCLQASWRWISSPIRLRVRERMMEPKWGSDTRSISPSIPNSWRKSSAPRKVGAREVCLQCGGSVFVPVLEDMSSVYSRTVTWTIASCVECGLLSTSPRPTREQLDQIYSTSYSYGAHDAVAVEKARRAQGLIEALKLDISGKEVLDIGCGSGVLLGQLLARGARVSGCEVSPDAVRQANECLGFKAVTRASVEDYLRTQFNLPEIVILSHTLEHLLDPLATLRRISALLPPQGKLVVVVPNTSKAPKGRLRRHWGYFQVPVHVVHFTEKTLKRMLASAGFIPEVTDYRNADFLSIGFLASNILGLDVQQAAPKGALTAAAIRLGSTAWSHTYKWGAQDLIVVAALADGKVQAGTDNYRSQDICDFDQR